MEQKFISAFKAALDMENHEIQLSDNFRDYEEWDSLGHLSVIAMLDEEFGIVIEQNEFNNLKTIGELIEAIKSKA